MIIIKIILWIFHIFNAIFTKIREWAINFLHLPFNSRAECLRFSVFSRQRNKLRVSFNSVVVRRNTKLRECRPRGRARYCRAGGAQPGVCFYKTESSLYAVTCSRGEVQTCSPSGRLLSDQWRPGHQGPACGVVWADCRLSFSLKSSFPWCLCLWWPLWP